LNKLWDIFDQFDFSPEFLAVPGNHDLVRPKMKASEKAIFDSWLDNSNIQAEFWEDPESLQRQIVTKAFENYIVWWDRQKRRSKILSHGILPGEYSATIEKEGAKLGILGLNTTFLQLTSENYEGRLAVHPRQFQGACKDGPAWANEHHACLLLTHHPPSWLDSSSQEFLKAEIAPYGRFAVHLCGHLHDTAYHNISEGGSEPHVLWQGRSLFGLEYYNDKKDRSHGYTIGRIEFRDKRTGALLFFPREGRKQQGNQRKIVPDYNLDLTNSFPHTREASISLLQDYQGVFCMGEKFDINSCRELAKAISRQHIRLKRWKELHENLQILCVRFRHHFIPEIKYWMKSSRDEKYSNIYRIVCINEPGWSSIRNEISLNIEMFKHLIEHIQEQLEEYEDKNTQEWIERKMLEWERKSYELETAYKEIEQLISRDWQDPKIDSKLLDDSKISIIYEKFHILARIIDEYLTIIDGNLKEEVSFFELHLKSFGDSLSIDLNL
jgi:hypothetical protein